ncbi:WD40 repeat-like protein [Trichocladium antarcticum]|uniref:WD40 repeat-like protein n=1 Tax=Trichocladium antarcticum TaxID=1450529 RepID=A0AAN6UIJ0_9PEZI|nr:WD40 repeat-like protein [Trichocladium antarcticum]
MSSSTPRHNPEEDEDSGPEMIAEDEIQEVLDGEDGDGDVAMGSDDEGDEDDQEMYLQNDSTAYFDGHKDSVFAIAQHPLYPNLVATGGSEGEADDAPGKGYVIDISTADSRPVLPPSYNAGPPAPRENTALQSLFAIDGHTDSINAMAFTLPRGDFLVSGGMDGRVRVYAVRASNTPSGATAAQFKFVAESQETEEINWLAPCPSPDFPNTVALGASDGSVWVLTIDASDRANPIQIVQSYFLHTGPCTAGAWTPDGLLLATVAEDASLHVYDVFGAAAAKSLVTDNGQTVVSLTEADQRFAVEGGLYSVAVAPTGNILAVGGASGAIRIVGLPRLQSQSQQTQQPRSSTGAILAALAVQQDSVESLAFSPTSSSGSSSSSSSSSTTLLLAAGSVDGSIAVFDAARSFALRRHLRGAHDGESVVRVDFVRAPAAGPALAGWLLTSCGLDGVVRRWDLRGAAAGQQAVGSGTAASGLVKEWRGHRGGGGEGGGVMGFVQGETGERVVTAGDDGVVLVFEA